MGKLTASKLAVCSWSMQPAGPAQLLEHLAAIGLRRVQIALDPLWTQPAVWGGFRQMCAQKGVEVISGMMVAAGEDYSTPETIRRTGGVVPDATWEENWRNFQKNADVAEDLGLTLVTFHAGFLPHNPAAPEFAKLLARVARVADMFAERGLELVFETGQETADDLESFLVELNRPNVGVNFDPANMILYDKGDPMAALRKLAPRLRQCHIKDAVRTTKPGEWGQEVAAGQGQVDWRAFFRTLEEIGYTGNLAIEREAGNQRVADIRAGKDYVTAILAGA